MINIIGNTISNSNVEEAISYHADSLSLFNRGSFTDAEKVIIDETIVKLNSDNQWTHIYELKLYGVSSQANALLDWKNASYNATKVGSPVFTAYNGWTGTASTADYIRSGFNPNGVVSLNSVLSIAWELSDEASNGALFGCQSGANQGFLLIPRSAGNTAITRLNSSANDAVAQTGRPVGYWRLERNASTGYTVHIQQTLKSNYVKTSSSVPNFEVYDLAINNSGVASSAGLREIAARVTASGSADSQLIADALNDCLVRLNGLANSNKTPRGYAYGDRLTWEGLTMGAMICWTNNIPNGVDVYATNRTSPVFPVSSFAPTNVDVDDWIDFASSINLEYLVLTVQHNMGWSLFPFVTNIEAHTGKDSYNATISLPQVNNYGVGNVAISGTADQDIVHQFVTKCEAAGIQPVLYYNIGKDLNSRGGFATIAESSISSDPAITLGYAKYATMVEGRMQELLSAFPNIWLWLDAVAWYPRSYHQALFNRIRTRGNENTLVIYNYEPVQGSGDADVIMKPNGTNAAYYSGSLTGKDYYLSPFDISSFEHQRLPTEAAAFNKLISNNKHVYWTGKEICSNMFTNGQYFYWDQAIVGGTPNTLESAVNLNLIADDATSNDCPLVMALAPNLTGVISTAQKDRITLVATHIGVNP
jgi:hypothetical protein